MAMLRPARGLAYASRWLGHAFSTESVAATSSVASTSGTAPEPAAFRTLDGLPFPTLVLSKRKEFLTPVSVQEAIALVKAGRRARFDETVDLALNLGIDPRRGDQMVRGATELPHGTGRAVRVAVFATGQDAVAAQEAGAEVVGGEELIASIAGGASLDFDRAVATPAMMPKVGRVARILGPRGLMPNPKLGTVTASPAEAVAALKRGRVEFRADKGGVVHAGLGKRSFADEALYENVAAYVAAILAARPKGLKGGVGGYVKGATLSTTMGVGVPVSIASLVQAAAATRA